MISALYADGPDEECVDELMLFGRLVGSWDCVGRFYAEDGSVREEHQGEWHFGWVLGGRAIQDVLISPPRGDRDTSLPFFEYGSAIRVFDPALGAWRVTVVSAARSTSIQLLARAHGDEIWLEGRSDDGRLLRWTFSSIRPASVHWQGYVSLDEGATWVRDEEILLTRAS